VREFVGSSCSYHIEVVGHERSVRAPRHDTPHGASVGLRCEDAPPSAVESSSPAIASRSSAPTEAQVRIEHLSLAPEFCCIASRASATVGMRIEQLLPRPVLDFAFARSCACAKRARLKSVDEKCDSESAEIESTTAVPKGANRVDAGLGALQFYMGTWSAHGTVDEVRSPERCCMLSNSRELVSEREVSNTSWFEECEHDGVVVRPLRASQVETACRPVGVNKFPLVTCSGRNRSVRATFLHRMLKLLFLAACAATVASSSGCLGNDRPLSFEELPVATDGEASNSGPAGEPPCNSATRDVGTAFQSARSHSACAQNGRHVEAHTDTQVLVLKGIRRAEAAGDIEKAEYLRPN